ncbi:MAG TPA: NADH-quinone oxidoreductase subunit H [Anaeromyxobacteraceae bacterium]|nr:NADH-quinone oxidoreductase subunit H [Anaeromyxobacteraceae bacterium]
MLRGLLQPLLLLLLAPLLPGVVNRVKAVLAGRQGPPLWQLYADLGKLLRKGAVYSGTTSWVFRAGPMAGLASAAAAALLLPVGAFPAPVSFSGDFLLFAGLLALGRFLTALAAMDTGSAFEGMGAAREVTFGSAAEPALLLGLSVLARTTGSTSLQGMLGPGLSGAWAGAAPSLTLAAVALGLISLAENARIPVDDPNTHLELTMIHEVMVLDHSGPDLAFVQAGAALKLLLFGSLLAQLLLAARPGGSLWGLAAFAAGLAAFALLVGVVESAMARLKMQRVPQLLVGAAVLSLFALVLVLR